MILKYDLTLQKNYPVGFDREEGTIYDSYDYEVKDYEFEIDDERLVEILAGYESVEHKELIRDNLEELAKEYKWELYEDLEEEIKEQAYEDMYNGWL